MHIVGKEQHLKKEICWKLTSETERMKKERENEKKRENEAKKRRKYGIERDNI